MNETLKQEEIIKLVKTVGDVNGFLWILEGIEKSKFIRNVSINIILESQLPYEKNKILVSLATRNKVNLDDATILRAFCEDIKKILQKIPIVSMTTAFPLTENQINRILEWFLMQEKKAIVLDGKVDAAVIGGALIGINGRMWDFSLKTRLEHTHYDGRT